MTPSKQSPRSGGSGNGQQGAHTANDNAKRRPVEGCQKISGTNLQVADADL